MKRKELKITQPMDFGVTMERAEAAMAKLNALLNDPERKSGMVILGGRDLSDDEICPLLQNDTLHKIVGRWYYVADPDLPPAYREPDAWNAVYWDFVKDYLNERFGENWCLGSDQSLLLYSGDGQFPRQLRVRSEGASTGVVDLPWGYEILVVGASLPKTVETEKRFGLRVYPLNHAVLAASPGFYIMHPTEMRTCLEILSGGDVHSLAMTAVELGLVAGGCKVAGGLHSIGHPVIADSIMAILKEADGKAEMIMPFKHFVTVPKGGSAVATRMRLLWDEMRPQVLREKRMPCARRASLRTAMLFPIMRDAYIQDTAFSLATQGYDNAEDLARRIYEKDSDPVPVPIEVGDEDLAAALGYRKAFEQVATDILDSVTGGKEPERLLDRIKGWHSCLTTPLCELGLMDRQEAGSFRTMEIPAGRTPYIPVTPGEIPTAMETLSDMISHEPDEFVRAIFGYFFIMYIQPFRYGNAMLAYLFMNSQLVTGETPWTIIPGDMADECLYALEEALGNKDIGHLAGMVQRLIERPARPKTTYHEDS